MDTRHKIKSYSKVLSERYGELGTPERVEFENDALDFYASQVAMFNREESKFAQKELSYISKADENDKIA